MTFKLSVGVVENNIDKVESYGDNNTFKVESAEVLFSESNPFGDVGT